MKPGATAIRGLLPLNMQSHIPKYYLNENPKVLDIMGGIIFRHRTERPGNQH